MNPAKELTHALPALRLRDEPSSKAVGVIAALAMLALITILIYPLRGVVPTISAGVIYVVPVMVVSTWWGLGLGLATAIGGALAFNFFHISPTGALSVSDPEHLIALGVFLLAAIAVSTLADLARSRAIEAERRRLESEIAAEMAHLLLAGASPTQAAPQAAARLGAMLALDGVEIELDARSKRDGSETAGDDRLAFDGLEIELAGTGGAKLILPGGIAPQQLSWLETRVAPQLGVVLSAAIDRQAVQEEAIDAQALRRSDESKTAILRAVSHDLRSPLTAILASAEAISSPTLESADREQLAEAILTEAERLSRLVENLLDLSRLEGGAAEPHLDWCSVEEVLSEAVREVEAPAVQLAIEEGLPLVRADPVQLERALINLIENGSRYSEDQPVTVSARHDEARVTIRVVDHGPGIPQADLERVFQPFLRLNTGVAKQGSGLGLAIAKGFVEANRGTIRAESLPGQGAAFVVELPAEPHEGSR